MLVGGATRALALNPALDVSQYAHTAWKVRDGAFKDSIAAIAQTPDGYLWLGTQFGLLRFDGVRHVVWQPPAGQQLPSMNIRSLFAARDGRLWIGTQLGLASFKDGVLTLHPEMPGLVGGIVEDRDGTVWAGLRYPPPGKLCAFRRDGVQCYGGTGEFGERASSVYEDRAGTLWLGTQTALWRWRPGPPVRYPLGDFESSAGLVEGGDGTLLIAERNGLKQLRAGKLTEYPLPASVRGAQPSHLLRDRDGALWIGTFDRGIIHVRPPHSICIHSPMDCPATTSETSSRIAKATSGWRRRTASTVFARPRSRRCRCARDCRKEHRGPSWPRGTAACGSARSTG
jgi:ligand-binding sensor domain-containing protein